MLASRLGYRMTAAIARKYFGRIFLHPHVVFTEEMLRPELQDPASYGGHDTKVCGLAHRGLSLWFKGISGLSFPLQVAPVAGGVARG